MSLRLDPQYGRLLGGTAAVAGGLVAAGIGTVLMLALGARALTPEKYASFAIWWTIATLLGITFGVFEAYLARLVITEVAAERDASRVTAEIAGRAAGTAIGLSLVCALLAWPLARIFFTGSLTAALLLPLFLSITAAQALLRGVATGHRRFRAVSAQLLVDGLLRAAITGVLVAAGWASLETLAGGACLAAAASLVAGDHLCPQWRVRPRRTVGSVPVRPLVLLLVGAIGPVLSNSGSAPWLAAVGHKSALTIGAFVGALTLSRLPTQFVSAAFGPLLAELAHAVEAHDRARFTQLQRAADLACAGAAVVFVAAFALLGRFVLSIYLGPDFRLPVLTLALLAAASGLMLSAVVRQAGLAALDRWGTIAAAWTTATVGLGLVLALPIDALTRAAVAPVATVLLALAILVGGRQRTWAREGAA